LFMNNSTEIEIDDEKLVLEQTTNYPWSGDVSIKITSEDPVETNLMIRIPGWARNEAVPGDLYQFTNKTRDRTTILVNGKTVDYEMQKGYAVLPGRWQKDDRIDVSFPMEVQTIVSHPQVMENAGKVAIQRGPILYCAEGVDNEGHAIDLAKIDGKIFKASFENDLLNGVTVLRGSGRDAGKKLAVQLIPYYAWSHREIGPMAVWLDQ